MGEVRRMYREEPVARPAPAKKSGGQRKRQHYDFPMLFIIILLVMFGNVMIFSSSYYYCLTNPQLYSSMYYFLFRQLRWSIVGLAVMIFVMNFDYRILRRLSFPGYVVSNILLVLVQLIGTEEKGSKRWLGYGPIQFQPSEVAKICVILFLAHYILTHKDILKTFKGFVQCMVILMIPVVLIGVANLSTAIIVLGFGIMMIFVASPKIWYFVAAGVPLCGLGGIAVTLPMFRYRFKRITAWLDPFSDMTDSGYQIIQSLYAVASGGLFGLGLGQSRQKTFVPEAYNDIIFAIICEELGMVGAFIVIALFAILVWRGIKIAMNAQDMYGCLVAVGVVSMIAIQALINIAVVTNTIPNTGVPLPFISYGGTSLVFTMAAMGIVLNISRYQKRVGA